MGIKLQTGIKNTNILIWIKKNPDYKKWGENKWILKKSSFVILFTRSSQITKKGVN